MVNQDTISGPEFRFRPDGVVLNTPSAFKKIFGPKGNVRKSDYYRVWPRNVHSVNTWSSTKVSVHARKRRVLNYAFSEAALRDAEVFLHSNMDRWLELIGQQASKDGEWTKPINMCDWMNWLVFDILGDLCFGKNFDMKEPESDLRHIPEVMATFLELLHPIAFGPFADVWVWLKPRGLDWLLTVASPPAVVKWQEFVTQCLENRSKDEQELEKNPKPEGEVRKDFFHWLFKAVDPETGERGYDLNELYAECELLTIAGSDTTSVVMSAAFFYLAKQPGIQAKIAQEVRSTFASYNEIKSGSKLVSCKYLTAFLQEAMRMTPPVAAEPSREVLPGGTSVDNHYFPAGLHVSTGLYCLSYNSNVYPEPFKFRPERWIVDESGKEGSSAESVALAESGFCAFSFGTRGCVGKNLAWLEMRLAVAKTLWMYEVQGVANNNLGGGDRKAQPGRQVEDQYQIYDMFVANRKGPMLQMRKRQQV
ncbi:cytochrome p450 67 [Stemphylium lycopersici]|uniref:Cytochrome p450 67 n=1 Tax=Stemphylium lycopersici TaxID=183478 RepID=A0A364NG60_STELY|nr:cytochrome p450 67 [Stemphylium lycopersici]RAR03790.1 cytochrome p450 67 [Stemphylium lycopersici]RAR16217.1 cytochrome p450 67 [Stemphylium lycopersici]